MFCKVDKEPFFKDLFTESQFENFKILTLPSLA